MTSAATRGVHDAQLPILAHMRLRKLERQLTYAVGEAIPSLSAHRRGHRKPALGPEYCSETNDRIISVGPGDGAHG